MTPTVLILTVVAGTVGALVRYVVHAAPARPHPREPRPRPDGRIRGLEPAWRILVINVAASFLAGVALATLPEAFAPIVVTGFCGGLSTWSTFMTDAHRMWSARRRGAAVALVAASIGYGLLAALAGYVLTTVLGVRVR